ncbi:hypothetical protein RUND412_000366 [Rhizina undulata]
MFGQSSLYLFGSLVLLAESVISTPVKRAESSSQDILAVLSSYSTATGDCAYFLNQRFYTTTMYEYPTAEATGDLTTSTEMYTITADSTVTETPTMISKTTILKTFSRAITGFEHTVTETSTGATTTSFVTTTINDPSSTITSTVISGVVTITASAPMVTVTITATTTVTGNVVPSSLTSFGTGVISSACSAFLSLPISTPCATLTSTGTTSTKTSYLTTSTKSSTVTIQAATVTTDQTTTVLSTMYSSSTSSYTTTFAGTLTSIHVITAVATTTLTRKIPSKTTVTSSGTTTVTPSASGTTSVYTYSTVYIPPPCVASYIPTASKINVTDGAYALSETYSSLDFTSCCAKCGTSTGCALFSWESTESCGIYVVTEVVSGKQGWPSEECPMGQIQGDYLKNTTGTGAYSFGPCWAGDF